MANKQEFLESIAFNAHQLKMLIIDNPEVADLIVSDDLLHYIDSSLDAELTALEEELENRKEKP